MFSNLLTSVSPWILSSSCFSLCLYAIKGDDSTEINQFDPHGIRLASSSRTTGECRLYTTESPEISTLLGEALEGLRVRQVLFK
jgi:hypothetical protein